MKTMKRGPGVVNPRGLAYLTVQGRVFWAFSTPSYDSSRMHFST